MYRLIVSALLLVSLSACVTVAGPNSWDHAAKRCKTVGRWDNGVKLRLAGYERLPDLTNGQYWDMVTMWKQQTGDLAQPEYFFLFEHPQQPGKTHVVAVTRGCVIHEEAVASAQLDRFLKLQSS